MNANDISIGMGFISDSLPVEKAVFSGIICTRRDMESTPKKIFFKRIRANKENNTVENTAHEEEFSFFVDVEGNVNMGHWTPFVNLLDACAFVKNATYTMDWDGFNMERAKDSIQETKALMLETLEKMRNGV